MIASLVAGTITSFVFQLAHVVEVTEMLDAPENCLLYTSDAADERSSVDLGGRRIIKKKKKRNEKRKREIEREDAREHTNISTLTNKGKAKCHKNEIEKQTKNTEVKK